MSNSRTGQQTSQKVNINPFNQNIPHYGGKMNKQKVKIKSHNIMNFFKPKYSEKQQ